MLGTQAAVTGAAALVLGTLDLHTHAPHLTALVSFGALAAAWTRLVLMLRAPSCQSRQLVLLGATLLLAYTLVYLAIPTAFSNTLPPPKQLPGLHRTVDALYFTTTTATTVGYGDRVPVTTLARVLVMSQYAAGACLAVLIANHFA